jgi:uncharacterized protein YceK
MKNIILVIVMMLIAGSCSTIQTAIDPLKKYKLDLFMKNKEYSATGMMVLPKKDLYSIIFESEGKMDYFTFKTCSRETVIIDGRRLLNRKEVQINYRPNEIEKSMMCAAQVYAVSKDMTTMSGYIDFENDVDKASAILTCGEDTQKTYGTSVCQGRIGLIERIDFEDEMIVSPDEGCKNIRSENGTWQGKGFTINIERDYCIFVFMQKNPPHNTHKLTTFGYDEILNRL